MRSLVTGASGFIGRNLLEIMPDDTIAMVRKDIPGRNCVICDMEHADRLPELVDDIDTIYHLAWSGASGAERNDVDIQNINVINSLRLAEAAVKIGCKKFVFCGSIAVRRHTGNPYEVSKRDAAKAISNICSKNGIQFAHAILPSTYGEGSSGFVTEMLEGMMKGSDILVKNGDGLNDLVHVQDVINGLKLIGKNGIGEYFIGTGKPRKIRDFIGVMMNFTNSSSAVEIRSEEQSLTMGDLNIDAISSLGYVPAVDFEEGIRKMISLSRSSI
jgi:Nucleoside-diphosphate-sugar epimerases